MRPFSLCFSSTKSLIEPLYASFCICSTSVSLFAMTAVARMDATRATTTTALMVHPQKEWEVAGPTMFDVQFYLLSIRILGMSFSKSAALKYKYLPYLSGKNCGSRQDTRVSCHACRVSHEGKTPRPRPANERGRRRRSRPIISTRCVLPVVSCGRRRSWTEDHNKSIVEQRKTTTISIKT